MWRRKFEALLPEVEKRQLYKKHKFHSIFEFAAVMGGVSRKIVEEVLRVHRRIEDKPLLRAEIAEKGWGKVRAVTPLLDTVDEKDLVNMVQTMPKRAIEVAVKEIRRQGGVEVDVEVDVEGQSAMGLELEFDEGEQCENGETPPGWGKETARESQSVLSFRVDGDVEFQLRKLKQAMEKERKEVVSFNEVLKTLLGMGGGNGHQIKMDGPEVKPVERQEAAVEGEKEEVKKECRLEGDDELRAVNSKKAITRYVPVAKRRKNDQKYKGKCSYPGCNKPQDITHYQERFALSKNHEKVVPLCKTHHQIVHYGLVENEGQTPENWRVTAKVDKNSLKYEVDKKFQRFQMRR